MRRRKLSRGTEFALRWAMENGGRVFASDNMSNHRLADGTPPPWGYAACHVDSLRRSNLGAAVGWLRPVEITPEGRAYYDTIKAEPFKLEPRQIIEAAHAAALWYEEERAYWETHSKIGDAPIPEQFFANVPGRGAWPEGSERA
jgi:hypothetical protein